MKKIKMNEKLLKIMFLKCSDHLYSLEDFDDIKEYDDVEIQEAKSFIQNILRDISNKITP